MLQVTDKWTQMFVGPSPTCFDDKTFSLFKVLRHNFKTKKSAPSQLTIIIIILLAMHANYSA